MMNDKTLAKVISGTLIGAMLLMAGGIVLASNLDPNSTGGNPPTKQVMQDRKGHRPPNDIDMRKKLTDDLAGLVKAGTLTQEKADKVVAYFDKNDAERKADMEKVKPMTPEERRAYMDKAKETKKDPLTQLVADGVITQQEADAIAKVHCPAPHHEGKMRPPMQNGKGHGGMRPPMQGQPTEGNVTQS